MTTSKNTQSLPTSAVTRLDAQTSAQPEQLMTVEDLCTYLNVPVDTFYKWSSRGDAPKSFRLGRGLRFRREDVDAWLESKAA